MNDLAEFKRTGHTFDDRCEPDASMTALGRVIYWFCLLDDQVTASVHFLRRLAPDGAETVISDLSFQDRLHMMASQVRGLSGKRKFNTGTYDEIEWLNKIVASCVQAEKLRDQVLQSSWTELPRTDRLERLKVSTKAPSVLYYDPDEMDADYLMDIADFILTVRIDVEEFFYEVNEEEHS